MVFLVLVPLLDFAGFFAAGSTFFVALDVFERADGLVEDAPFLTCDFFAVAAGLVAGAAGAAALLDLPDVLSGAGFAFAGLE